MHILIWPPHSGDEPARTKVQLYFLEFFSSVSRTSPPPPMLCATLRNALNSTCTCELPLNTRWILPVHEWACVQMNCKAAKLLPQWFNIGLNNVLFLLFAWGLLFWPQQGSMHNVNSGSCDWSLFHFFFFPFSKNKNKINLARHERCALHTDKARKFILPPCLPLCLCTCGCACQCLGRHVHVWNRQTWAVDQWVMFGKGSSNIEPVEMSATGSNTILPHFSAGPTGQCNKAATFKKQCQRISSDRDGQI